MSGNVGNEREMRDYTASQECVIWYQYLLGCVEILQNLVIAGKKIDMI